MAMLNCNHKRQANQTLDDHKTPSKKNEALMGQSFDSDDRKTILIPFFSSSSAGRKICATSAPTPRHHTADGAVIGVEADSFHRHGRWRPRRPRTALAASTQPFSCSPPILPRPPVLIHRPADGTLAVSPTPGRPPAAASLQTRLLFQPPAPQPPKPQTPNSRILTFLQFRAAASSPSPGVVRCYR